MADAVVGDLAKLTPPPKSATAPTGRTIGPPGTVSEGMTVGHGLAHLARRGAKA